MAKVKYVGFIAPNEGVELTLPNGERRFVSEQTGRILQIPDEFVEGFTHPSAPSELWEPYDQAAKAIHKKLVAQAEPPPEETPAEPVAETTTEEK
jgi:hypothetical protein